MFGYIGGFFLSKIVKKILIFYFVFVIFLLGNFITIGEFTLFFSTPHFEILQIFIFLVTATLRLVFFIYYHIFNKIDKYMMQNIKSPFVRNVELTRKYLDNKIESLELKIINLENRILKKANSIRIKIEKII